MQDGITETNHQTLAYLLVTSAAWLQGLRPDVREEFLTIVSEVTAVANEKVAETEARNRQRLVDAGVRIRVLSPAQRKAWTDRMKPVWTRFEGEIGKDFIDAAVAANADPNTLGL
ncbi:C4-dicarboxylate-binding protein DctP [Consotaella salsifontis]|uniref:C4-dicarboxylate-binding protein DctP n=1 Tax=Consotaella salsifontis TaxID=1365950 RepID=A0A1T4MU86_9HYPH|nr:C4-dicarboxylate-binding protein DctP [Consotaella salsifontis]